MEGFVYPLGPTYDQRFARRSEGVPILDMDHFETQHGSVHVGPVSALFWWRWRWGEVSGADRDNPDFAWVVVEAFPFFGRFQWPRTFESTSWAYARNTAGVKWSGEYDDDDGGGGGGAPAPTPPPSGQPAAPASAPSWAGWLVLAAIAGGGWYWWRRG